MADTRPSRKNIAASGADADAPRRRPAPLPAQLAAQTAQLERATAALFEEMSERQTVEEELLRVQEKLEARVEERTAALQAERDERRQAEEALRSAHSQLDLRVHQRTAELAEANRCLAARNQEVQNFYHTLSHELKTPLTAAREFICILLDGLAGPLTATQREYLGIARDSCNQLRVCLNDLLDATRLETGKLRAEFQPASLAALARRVVTLLTPAAQKKGIRLSLAPSPPLPDIPLDEHRVTQVITNLLHNALKFTDAGGLIEVTVAGDAAASNGLRLAVRDTGRGIPPDQLARIFDRHYQIQSGDAATEHGVGLGLYLCRELVQLHHGSIRAESEPGRGSVFTFTLPQIQPDRRAHVLLVDDESALLDLLRPLLEREGFLVTTAADGVAALRALHAQRAELVVLDLAMPDMDGPSTLLEIRRRWGAVPVVIHTGHPDGDLMARALECAPFTLLGKPCAPRQFVETVRGLCRRAGASPPGAESLP